MTPDATESILVALFCLCRDTARVDATTLAQLTGHTPTLAAQALIALERAGLVDATRARLTMLGLARAARLAAAQRGGGGRQPAANSSKQLKPAQLVARARIKPPVAARAASTRGQETLLQHVAGAGVSQ